MNDNFEELEENFNTYFLLSIAQGQINVLPRVKNNIKAFIQWVRDDIWM